MKSKLPRVIQSKLDLFERLESDSRWWLNTDCVLQAFRQLAEFEIDPMLLESGCVEPGWTVISTPARPSSDADNGCAIIHKTATIMPGSVLIGDVVIGDHCEIGPNCTIFGPTVIGPGSYIGPGAEIRRTFVFSRLKLAHQGYLGHSIVGNCVNLAAGFKVAVRNLKRKTVHVQIDEELVNTFESMFGAIIADNFYCSVNTTVMPGRLLIDPIVKGNS